MSNSLSNLRKQQQLAAHAHRMRVAPSEPERVLWLALGRRSSACSFGGRSCCRATSWTSSLRRRGWSWKWMVRITCFSAARTRAGTARSPQRGFACCGCPRRSSPAISRLRFKRSAARCAANWAAERGGRARLEARLRRRHDARRRRPPRRTKSRRETSSCSVTRSPTTNVAARQSIVTIAYGTRAGDPRPRPRTPLRARRPRPQSHFREFPSASRNWPMAQRIRSTSDQIPQPPSVTSFAIPRPTCPATKRSIPN